MNASPHACLRTRPPRPAGFSLTELLVASAITLVIMGALAQLFSMYSRSLSQSQASVALNGQIRNAAWKLRKDLAGTTVAFGPWIGPENGAGYFELIEGARRDAVAAHGTDNLEADIDDMLFFTTRSSRDRLVGSFGPAGVRIESPYAEVAWFCRPAQTQPLANTRLYDLHRRQLIVADFIGRPPFSISDNAVPPAQLVNGPLATPVYDLSLRLSGTLAVPNSLADLTKRENRLFLGGTASVRSGSFPHQVMVDEQNLLPRTATFTGTERESEDVMLANVIAFDVRVFDPTAVAQQKNGVTLFPSDSGYTPWNPASEYATENRLPVRADEGTLAKISETGAFFCYSVESGSWAPTAQGCYVDLGWRGGSPTAISGTFPPSGTSAFESAGMRVSGTSKSATLPLPTYDTWSRHYEFNGLDDDGDGLIDEAVNGADDNGDGVPDNPPECETSPPYPVALYGIEIRIRCYEPTSRQVRQMTIRHTFHKH
jgi:prepilin-type N-terminal cleavage/methylation domain-containing protein